MFARRETLDLKGDLHDLARPLRVFGEAGGPRDALSGNRGGRRGLARLHGRHSGERRRGGHRGGGRKQSRSHVVPPHAILVMFSHA